MDDDSDRSSEETQLEENSTAEDANNLDDDDAEDSAGVDENTDDQRDVSPLEISHVSAEEDLRTCRSLTLVSGLSEVPVKYEMRRDELEHLKNQLQGSHQEALATVIAQAAQAHSESQLKLPGVLSSSIGLSSMPVTSILSLPSVPVLSSLQCSNSQGQIVSLVVNADSIHVAEANQKDATGTDPKPLPVKIPMDGYNWRKYGQKQVKSPEGSRSYYKCTYIECDAKKIESCDQFNSVTKIVYKGQHKHDPPKKVSSRGGKILSTPKSPKRKSISTPGLKDHRSSGSVGCVPIQVEQVDEPQQKQRVKKSSSENPGSVLKHPKKPKFIVHAAGDVEISADGYRWRKYGQKMVKGNPHPRNYYKCTSAGCLVRKHIEKAVDGASGVMITYKGVHDHDMPVPKKRQPPPTHLLNAKRSESTTETAKTSETTRTLLSVGFEIKNY
ncbi:probable WRKY transcription factor 32 [Cynara cardunculus var. scolymus]|uniref:probable WRKY transcription factor 32 n=1 Tax=Cynara cardunculus var. scolymus TaxID=59895 RepID=UPI000D6293A1|nr:probable WRKY transcription factor 32 [Cynara cardunculus var. scolymus]